MATKVLLALAGLVIGIVFLWLTLRGIDGADLARAVSRVRYQWLAAGVLFYLASIGLRSLRWSILLRASGKVRWRHVFEALLTGFAANYLLPGRIGELFRAEYARRLFKISRFTSIGTIVVERVCDGVILVCALWIGLTSVLAGSAVLGAAPPWMLTVAAVSSALFGAALVFVIVSRRLDIRRFGAPEMFAVRWSRLIEGVSSVAGDNYLSVAALSLGVWLLELLTLGSLVRAFTDPLSLPQMLLLLSLGSLSTLVPTAPGFIGTYQFVFMQVFALLGQQPSTGVVVATSMQIFCFGTVTVLGALVLLSRAGVTMWRAFDLGALKRADEPE